jgi:cytoskeletal protein RodZ
MAKGTFGERLKRERELREVTVVEICSATRIAPKFLDALENEQWEKLPGGVFGRGFVRTIARYLGLSEENLLSEYDLARGEANPPATQKPEERIPSAPKWLPAAALLVLIALVVGLIFGVRYAWRLYTAHRAAKKAGISAGQTLQFSASDGFVMASGNVSALLLQLNGQTVTLTGTPGSSGTISLMSSDLRPTAGGPTRP